MNSRKRCLNQSCAYYDKRSIINFEGCEECPYCYRDNSMKYLIKKFYPLLITLASIIFIILIVSIVTYVISNQPKTQASNVQEKVENSKVENTEKSGKKEAILPDNTTPTGEPLPSDITAQSVGETPFKTWLDTTIRDSFKAVLGTQNYKLSKYILFKSDQNLPEDGFNSDIDKLVKFVQNNKYKDYKILIIGFSDVVGTPKYNLTLSQNRAEYIKNQFLARDKNIAYRMQVLGLGQEQPVADNTNEDGRRLNRRVEVWLTK